MHHNTENNWYIISLVSPTLFSEIPVCEKEGLYDKPLEIVNIKV